MSGLSSDSGSVSASASNHALFSAEAVSGDSRHAGGMPAGERSEGHSANEQICPAAGRSGGAAFPQSDPEQVSSAVQCGDRETPSGWKPPS